MSTPAGVSPDPDEVGIPYGVRLGQVAAVGGDATAVVFVDEDGGDPCGMDEVQATLQATGGSAAGEVCPGDAAGDPATPGGAPAWAW